jgi:DNA-binding CsgD family transcriptional regulator
MHYSKEINKQKNIAVWSLAILVALTTFDIWEDYLDGAPFEHISFEVGLSLFGLVSLGVIFYRSVYTLRGFTRRAQLQVSQAQDEAKKWRDKVLTVRQGLANAIEQQLIDWGLTESEKEVAMLLLKGLTNKEIAEIRGTVEKTVRQQAVNVYAKSGLEGRAQLSAFFMEDLLPG